MKDLGTTNTQSFQMFDAINRGMLDIYLPQQIESEIVNTMADILVEHENNFQRCSNEMRNMFFHCCQCMTADIQANMASIPEGYRLSILWEKVCVLM